jgi:hypothetical protein
MANDLVVTWLQILLGALIMAGGETRWRRLGLWVSIGWSLLVWGIGEGLGGLLAHGGCLTGSPGSALLYGMIAGVLLLSDRWWMAPDWEAGWRRAFTALWVSALVWQIWPPDGWWSPTQGLAPYIRLMAAIPQPGWMSAPLWAWAALVARAPVAWNATLSLLFLGLALAWTFRGQRWWTWVATLLIVVGTWWLGQDGGAWGGVGTDPPSGAVVLLALGAYAVRGGSADHRKVDRGYPEELARRAEAARRPLPTDV